MCSSIGEGYQSTVTFLNLIYVFYPSHLFCQFLTKQCNNNSYMAEPGLSIVIAHDSRGADVGL